MSSYLTDLSGKEWFSESDIFCSKTQEAKCTQMVDKKKRATESTDILHINKDICCDVPPPSISGK